VKIDAPQAVADKLYRFEFALSPDDANEKVLLYASLVVKKRYLDAVSAKLGELKVNPLVDNYHVYAPGIALKKDDHFEALATKAVEAMVKLFQGVKYATVA
jgi:hypothetical protein